MSKQKRKPGRPSSYKAAYCQTTVEFMSGGYSVTALAGHIGVARSTVFKWAAEHPEFSDALKTGQAAAALWWENALRQVAVSGVGSASAAIFGVKNRSNQDWSDKVEHDLRSGDGSMTPQPTQIRLVAPGHDDA